MSTNPIEILPLFNVTVQGLLMQRNADNDCEMASIPGKNAILKISQVAR
jgi:hypothetical protein